MSDEKNKHGLSRYIPAGIARAVRQRDGFGCVVCGLALIDYEHFEPEFVDATAHTVDGICLLCPICHRSKGTLLSHERIRQAIKNPKALEKGFSFGPFDPGTAHPSIRIGPAILKDCRHILEIDGEKIFSIEPPEKEGAPYRISAQIRDEMGREILRIVENEFRSPTENWDVTLVGNTLTVRDSTKANIFEMCLRAGEGIDLTNLNFTHRGLKIRAKAGQSIEFTGASGSEIAATALEIVGADTAIGYENGRIFWGRGGGAVTATGTWTSAPLPISTSSVSRIDFNQFSNALAVVSGIGSVKRELLSTISYLPFLLLG